CQRVCNAKCCGIVGAENCVQIGSVRIVTCDDGVHSVLSLSGIPCLCSAFLEFCLAGFNYQFAFVNVGLQNVHSAAVEEVCVVVVWCSRNDLQIERSFFLFQIQSFHDIFALFLAYHIVIESSIIGNCVRFHQQTVISDNRDACLFCLAQRLSERTSVDRSDYKDIASVGDHVLNLRYLSSNVVGRILKVYFVSCLFQRFLHVVAVLIPSLKILGGHRNAYKLSAALFFCHYCGLGNDHHSCRHT